MESQNNQADLSTVIVQNELGRIVCMGSGLTGLGECVNMSHTNYLKTPSGNETSIWDGIVPDHLIPASKYTYSATWFEDGKTYSSFTELTPDGLINITLHHKASLIGSKEVCMGKAITNLEECVNMIQTNYIIAPSGNETSMWDGNIPATQMARLFPGSLSQPYTYSTTWVEDEKDYSSITRVNKNGGITVKLSFKDR
jgi:hypothetical protein